MSENKQNRRCAEGCGPNEGTAKPRTERGKYMTEETVSSRRKRRAWLVLGLVVATAMMIAFVHYEQMTYLLGMAFNAPIAAVLGYNMK